MALCLEVMGNLRFPIALLRKKGADLFFYFSIFLFFVAVSVLSFFLKTNHVFSYVQH